MERHYKMDSTVRFPTILYPWGDLSYDKRLSLMSAAHLWHPKYFGENLRQDVERNRMMMKLAEEAIKFMRERKVSHSAGSNEAYNNREYALHYEFFMLYNYILPFDILD